MRVFDSTTGSGWNLRACGRTKETWNGPVATTTCPARKDSSAVRASNSSPTRRRLAGRARGRAPVKRDAVELLPCVAEGFGLLRARGGRLVATSLRHA